MSIRAAAIAALLLLATADNVLAQVGPQNQRRNQQADPDAAAAAVGGMICVGVAVVIGIALKVLIIVFIITDARKRGMDPTLYVLIEIFVGIIGLIVYLCVREPLVSEPRRSRRRCEEDELDDLDRPRRSRRLRDRDDDYDQDHRRDYDY